MESHRFNRGLIVTDHARQRMTDRGITDDMLLDLIETGEIRHKDAARLWIAKHYPERNDNLICAAVVLESAVVVKTVMHHFSWEPPP